MTDISGNPIRDQMIFDAIRECNEAGEALTPELVGKYLPGHESPGGYFDLLPSELDAARMAMQVAEVGATMAAYDATRVLPLADVTGEMHATETPDTMAEPAPALSREEAADCIRVAHEGLSRWRAELIAAGNRQRKARADLAAAVSAFVAGQMPITREQLVRQEIAAAQQHKLDVRAGRVPPRQATQRGKSYIDRANGHGGTAADHVRQNLQRGYRRGSYPSYRRGTFNHDPARGPVAKVPSGGR